MNPQFAPLALLWGLATGHPDAWQLKWAADSAGVPPVVAWAVAYQESRHNLNPALQGHHCAGRPKCERGRLQVLPATAQLHCPHLDIRTYEGNVKCGLTYLRYWFERRGSWERAIRAYQCPSCTNTTEYERDVLTHVGRFALRLGLDLPK